MLVRTQLDLSRRRLSVFNTPEVSHLLNHGSTTPTHPSLPTPSPPPADVFLRLDQRYQSVIADICQKMGAGMAEFVTDSAAESEVGARGGWCEGGCCLRVMGWCWGCWCWWWRLACWCWLVVAAVAGRDSRVLLLLAGSHGCRLLGCLDSCLMPPLCRTYRGYLTSPQLAAPLLMRHLQIMTFRHPIQLHMCRLPVPHTATRTAGGHHQGLQPVLPLRGGTGRHRPLPPLCLLGCVPAAASSPCSSLQSSSYSSSSCLAATLLCVNVLCLLVSLATWLRPSQPAAL